MALKIRLRQQGRSNRQTFRLVVTDIRNPRDGKYLEMLGSYNPFQAENNIKINEERLNYWLSKGAEISENAQKLIALTAPQLIKDLKEKEHTKRLKLTAKRRELRRRKKGAAPKAASVKKVAKSEETPVAKKPRATSKRTKKEES